MQGSSPSRSFYFLPTCYSNRLGENEKLQLGNEPYILFENFFSLFGFFPLRQINLNLKELLDYRLVFCLHKGMKTAVQTFDCLTFVLLFLGDNVALMHEHKYCP